MASSLLKSTLNVGSMTLISRLMGFVRDMLTARLFGASGAYDAFLVAFKIPNFFRSLFAEGAFTQAFVPLLSEESENAQDQASLKQFINNVAGVLAVASLLVTILGIICAPYMINTFAPGFVPGGERSELAISMLRVTFPYLFFISLTALAGAILNTNDNFRVPAFTPVLLNIAIIVSALFLTPYLEVPAYALAIGVFIGGAAQLSFQIPFLWRIGLLPKFIPSFSNPAVKKLFKLMLPAIFGVSIVQINLLIGTLFASYLPTGSVTWLYYADRLMQFPLGLFGVALGTVVLPNLARSFAANKQEQYKDTLTWAVNFAVFVGLPAACGLYALAEQLNYTLFAYGHFSSADVINTANALKAYSIGVLAYILLKVLAAAFYARQDIKTPVKVAAVALIVNIIVCLALLTTYLHVGLALATSLSACVQCVILLAILWRRSYLCLSQKIALNIARIFFASGLMYLYIINLLNYLPINWQLAAWYMRLEYLIVIIFSSLLIYVLSLMLSGLKWQNFCEALQNS